MNVELFLGETEMRRESSSLRIFQVQDIIKVFSYLRLKILIEWYGLQHLEAEVISQIRLILKNLSIVPGDILQNAWGFDIRESSRYFNSKTFLNLDLVKLDAITGKIYLL